MSKCTECGNYGLMKMMTSGQPFQYFGDIPCQRCSELKKDHSEFVPVKKAPEQSCWSVNTVSPTEVIQKAVTELGYYSL